ncbi:MAG: uncharacterized protein JWR51_4601 [Devosia sp.]|uniref:hypothetical protein n=1 Tax=Devosia sp. TaxID=1871048 RepID=UPI00261E5A5A|nr:hypothetical protein [Devosia sp.]MDB5531498.1 uncharacterized protein [Devosia sp.]
MTRLTFFPLGNADTTLIRLADNQLVLLDYADMRDPSDQFDGRCDLPAALRKEMSEAGKLDFAVVCFTHLDNDHICGASDFFWLQHSQLYQGKGRPKIDELWVPAGAITETNLTGNAAAIRREARYRLLQGSGIKVFSRPELLVSFLAANGLTLESRKHCIVDAGTLVPGFSTQGSAKAEFFVHCPFAWRTDERGLEDRNKDSVVLHVTFNEDGVETKALLGSDVEYGTLCEIVKTSKKHGNEHRLEWDVLKLFHHCSYKSIGPEIGEDETESVEETKWLFEDQSRDGCIIVSPSKPIPRLGSAEDDDVQPPHRQAANHHKRIVRERGGEFKVTMETPDHIRPKPFRVDITPYGASISFISSGSTNQAISTPVRGG